MSVKNKLMTGLTAQSAALRRLRSSYALLALALICAALAFIALGAYIRESGRSRVVPYLVTVDRQGVVLGKGIVSEASHLPQSVIAATLCSFIQNLRLVTPDRELQRGAVLEVYSHVQDDSKACRKLNDFYREHNPFAADTNVSVQMNNVISQSERTLQLDWTELHSGERRSKTLHYRALISFSCSGSVPDDPKLMLKNPLGIYIDDFVISEVLS